MPKGPGTLYDSLTALEDTHEQNLQHEVNNIQKTLSHL